MAGKVLTFWLAERALEFSQRPGSSKVARMVAACIYSYRMLFTVMDGGRHVLTTEEAESFRSYALRHLKAWVWLHNFGMQAPLRTAGRRSWQLLPKLHFLWHLAHDTARTRCNPKMAMLLSAESYVGAMGRIARAAHRKTLSMRSLQRYKASLKQALKGLEGIH